MSVGRIASIAFLSCVLALAVPTEGPAQSDVVVEGTVSDTGRTPLNGVQVTVWRQGASQQDVTKGQGNYRVLLKPGRPIDRINYTYTGFDPGVVERLSGSSAQQIAKVLYRIGEPRSLEEVDAQVRAFEVLFTTAATATADFQPRAIGDLRNPQWRDSIGKLVVPAVQGPLQQAVAQSLRQRIQALGPQYGALIQ